MRCEECINFKLYRGSHDRYGLQLEPDDAECVGNVTENDLEKFFCNAETWDKEEDGCSCFSPRDKEELE